MPLDEEILKTVLLSVAKRAEIEGAVAGQRIETPRLARIGAFGTRGDISLVYTVRKARKPAAPPVEEDP